MKDKVTKIILSEKVCLEHLNFAARSGELDRLIVTVVHSDFPKILVSGAVLTLCLLRAGSSC